MSQATEEISECVRTYIATNLLFSDKGFSYGDDASFLDEGIIDSFGVIELVEFLETQFGLSVADLELVPENFDSVNRLTAYILRKRGVLADGGAVPC